MADIFISYAREDRPHVQRLAADLQKHGWTVWWDRHIHAGKHYDEVIQRELELVRAVIVLWSQHSVPSRWVKTEAREGLNRDILVPLQVDQSPVPLEFRQVQSIPFDGPALESGTAAFDDLIDALTGLLGTPVPRAAQAAPAVTAPAPAVVAPPVVSAHTPPIVAPPAVRSPDAGAPAPFERELSFEYPGDTSPRVPMRAWLIMAAAALVILVVGGVSLSFGPHDVPAAPQVLELHEFTNAAPPVTPPAAQPESAPAAAPALDAPPSGPAAPSDGAAADVAPPAFHDFVVAFLKAWSGGDVEQVLPLYASRVDYFDKGLVDQSFIQQDRLTYKQRWPLVTLQLEGSVMGRQEAGGFRLMFKTQYVALRSGNDGARGTTEVSLLVTGSSPESFRIAGHREGVKSAPF